MLHTEDILSDRVRAHTVPNSNQGVGISEAPRGKLMHHYQRDCETPSEVICTKVEPLSVIGAFTHSVSPASLLTTAQELYDAAPDAILISVTGASFDYGCTFRRKSAPDFHASSAVSSRSPQSDYATTQYAAELGLPVTYVQRHDAHVLSCMAEHQLEAPVLVWLGMVPAMGQMERYGAASFLVDKEGFTRVAHLRPFPCAAAVRQRENPGVVYLASCLRSTGMSYRVTGCISRRMN